MWDFDKFWVVISISWTFGLFAEAGKCQDKETCNCHKQRFTSFYKKKINKF